MKRRRSLPRRIGIGVYRLLEDIYNIIDKQTKRNLMYSIRCLAFMAAILVICISYDYDQTLSPSEQRVVYFSYAILLSEAMYWLFRGGLALKVAIHERMPE